MTLLDLLRELSDDDPAQYDEWLGIVERTLEGPDRQKLDHMKRRARQKQPS